jgi:hypothetical protein
MTLSPVDELAGEMKVRFPLRLHFGEGSAW